MKIAILGAGSIAQKMAQAVCGLGGDIEPYAVASRDAARAEAFRQSWGFEKAYGSYEQMLSDPAVDLVYIATPHPFHYPQAKLCIEYGKPVLVEKPFTVNAQQAAELFALAEQKHVFITEAIWTRYMPSRSIIDDLLASGVIGTPYMLTADLSYPISQKPRLFDPALAGGSLLDIGLYPIHFASMAFGDDIEKISGTCTYLDTGVDAQDSITMTYRDGRQAVLTCSMFASSHRFGIIYGSEGYIHCTNINNISAIEVFDSSHRRIREVPVPQQINGYEYEVLACRQALAEDRLECSEMPHTETVRILQWLDQLRAGWNIRYPFE